MAQEKATWDSFRQEFQLPENEQENSESVWDELEQLHDNPMNINLVSQNDLLKLPFLSGAQVDSILLYRQRYKTFLDLGELMYVKNLEYRERSYASLFLYCAEPDTLSSKLAHQWLLDGKHDLIVYGGFPLYKRAGNKHYSLEELQKNPNKIYLGNGLSTTIRYQYKYRERIAYGFVASKDAGEPFGNRENYPFDFSSFYVTYKPKSLPLYLLAGDYRIHAGLGLLTGSTFFFGKESFLMNNMTMQPSGFRAFSSGSESGFYRGLAASYILSYKLRFTCWASHHKLDATLSDDTVTSFKTDGLHRTLLELQKRRQVAETVVGGIAELTMNRWNVGINTLYTHYDKVVYPRIADYSRYYFRGKAAGGASVFGSYHGYLFHLLSEFAVDSKGHVCATVNSSYEFRDVTLMAQLRGFDAKFISLHGGTMQEGSKVRNEVGALLGAKWTISEWLTSHIYVDLFRFPRATFRASSPSQGAEFSVRFDTSFPQNPLWSAFLRYRVKTKQQDVTGIDHLMEYQTLHRFQLCANRQFAESIVTFGLEGTCIYRQTISTAFGGALYSRWHYSGNRWNAAAMASLFLTDGYSSRIVLYEPELAYQHGFAMLYYKGARLVAETTYAVIKKLEVALRYAGTYYFNRRQIGTGTQAIASWLQNDLMVQIRWRI